VDTFSVPLSSLTTTPELLWFCVVWGSLDWTHPAVMSIPITRIIRAKLTVFFIDIHLFFWIQSIPAPDIQLSIELI
jgi:hypothetical protein